jgi:hypothetical protein
MDAAHEYEKESERIAQDQAPAKVQSAMRLMRLRDVYKEEISCQICKQQLQKRGGLKNVAEDALKRLEA